MLSQALPHFLLTVAFQVERVVIILPLWGDGEEGHPTEESSLFQDALTWQVVEGGQRPHCAFGKVT